MCLSELEKLLSRGQVCLLELASAACVSLVGVYGAWGRGVWGLCALLGGAALAVLAGAARVPLLEVAWFAAPSLVLCAVGAYVHSLISDVGRDIDALAGHTYGHKTL